MAESQFPLQVDQIKRLQDFPQSQAANIARYQTLRQRSNLTSEEQMELQQLSSILSTYILTAEDFNLMASAIEATQVHLKNNVDGYIQAKQEEFNNIVQTKEQMFTNTIEIKEQEFNATLNNFTVRDQYNPTVIYQKWNIVTYGYETYLSKHDNNIGNTPVGDASDAHWAKIAYRGKQGVPGLGLVFVGEYNNAMTYQPQNAVRYNNKIYYCITPTTGNLPTDTNYWILFYDSQPIVVSSTPPENPNANPVWIDISA